MSSQPTDRRPGREEEQREECELLEEGPMKAGYPTRGTLAWPRSQELGEKKEQQVILGMAGCLRLSLELPMMPVVILGMVGCSGLILELLEMPVVILGMAGCLGLSLELLVMPVVILGMAGCEEWI